MSKSEVADNFLVPAAFSCPPDARNENIFVPPITLSPAAAILLEVVMNMMMVHLPPLRLVMRTRAHEELVRMLCMVYLVVV